MAIELPGELAWVMQLLGEPWPDINEDKVRDFAQHVRTFGDNVEDTHRAASGVIQSMADIYQAQSYELLADRWTQMSSRHLCEVVDVCHGAATVLEAAAGTIVGVKGAIIAQLVILAAEIAADQAAAVVTLGAAEAAGVALIALTKTLVRELIDQVVQHVVGDLIAQGVAPLESAVESAVRGLVFEGIADGLGMPTSGGNANGGFFVHPEALAAHGQKLQGFADEARNHALTFSAAIEGMSFQ